MLNADQQAEILSLHFGQGKGIRAIARILNIDPKSVSAVIVRRSVQLGRTAVRRQSILDPYKDYKDARFSGAWLVLRPLTKEGLEIFRKNFRKSIREEVTSLLTKSREDFLDSVRHIPTGGGGVKDAAAMELLGYMCDAVSDDCFKFARRSEQKKLSVFYEERKLFPGYNFEKIYSYYREIIKPENWDKLKVLAKPID